MQPDSIIPDPLDPIGFDRYAYARNNPIRYSDPTGHDIWDTVSDFTSGFVAEVLRTNFGFIPQVQEALAVNPAESDAVLAGRIVGDVVSIGIGVVEFAAGLGVATGGTVASCAGTACVASVATVGVGVAVMAAGGAVAINGGVNLGQNLALISWKAQNSKPLGIFEKNNIRTTQHFRDRLKEWGISEQEAYSIYQNGDKYTDTQGGFIIYDPKRGLAIRVDNYDKGVVTIFEQRQKPRGWKQDWFNPE